MTTPSEELYPELSDVSIHNPTKSKSQKRKEYNRAYYAANATRLAERLRTRKASDPDYFRRLYQKGSQNFRQRNPEYQSEWYKAHPEKSALYQKQYRYGLTTGEWNSLFLEQNSACAICRTMTPKGKKGWMTDHDHCTGEIRGILCINCNLLLGNAHDDAKTLESAILYLAKYKTNV